MPAADTRVPWMAGVFGLAVSGTVPTPGLSEHAAAAAPESPTVVLQPTPRLVLEDAWPSRGASRLSTVRRDGERRAVMTIDAHRDAGHRFSGVGYGLFIVPPGASEVRYAPAGPLWARYLHGQVLPFVAGLHGRELLHAGGVVTGEGAVAVCGPSGAGKTTLVGACLAAGAGFMADDVVALSRHPDGTVLAHPGPAVAGDDGKAHGARARPMAGPVPLQAVCFLRRGGARRIAIEPVAQDDPRPLLGAGYEAVRRDPERLTAQLDLLAAVAAQARTLFLHAPSHASPELLAEALLAELA